MSKTKLRRKIALGLWILGIIILMALLVLWLWSIIFGPDLTDNFLLFMPFIGFGTFFLIIIIIALNDWKPLLRK